MGTVISRGEDDDDKKWLSGARNISYQRHWHLWQFAVLCGNHQFYCLTCIDIPRQSYANSSPKPPQTRATSCRHMICWYTVEHTLCQNVHEYVKQCFGVGAGHLGRVDEKSEPCVTI
jgi:hypothetical protein